MITDYLSLNQLNVVVLPTKYQGRQKKEKCIARGIKEIKRAEIIFKDKKVQQK